MENSADINRMLNRNLNHWLVLNISLLLEQKPYKNSCLTTFLGVEYHLQQLADVRSAGVVLRHLDDARPTSLRHDVRPVPGYLRHRPGGAGLHERAASQPGRAVSGSPSGCHSGLWPEQLSPRTVRPPGSEGEKCSNRGSKLEIVAWYRTSP